VGAAVGRALLMRGGAGETLDERATKTRPPRLRNPIVGAHLPAEMRLYTPTIWVWVTVRRFRGPPCHAFFDTCFVMMG